MTGILLSLLVSQTAPTRADIVGAVNTMGAAHRGRASRTVTGNGTRVCIGPGKPLGARARTIRFGAVELSAQAQADLGLNAPTGPAYAAIEVQYDPDAADTADLAPLPSGIDPVGEEIEVRVSPHLAACEVAIIRMDAQEIRTAALMRCACAETPAHCTWTRPEFGGGSTQVNPAPAGITLSPGTWSGNGCAAKSCVVRAGPVDWTWPSSCAK